MGLHVLDPSLWISNELYAAQNSIKLHLEFEKVNKLITDWFKDVIINEYGKPNFKIRNYLKFHFILHI